MIPDRFSVLTSLRIWNSELFISALIIIIIIIEIFLAILYNYKWLYLDHVKSGASPPPPPPRPTFSSGLARNHGILIPLTKHPALNYERLQIDYTW